MIIDLIDTFQNFNHSSGCDLMGFLGFSTNMTTIPKISKETRKDNTTIEKTEIQYEIDGCEIFQERVVEYKPGGKTIKESIHRLTLSGEQVSVWKFADEIATRYKIY